MCILAKRKETLKPDSKNKKQMLNIDRMKIIMAKHSLVEGRTFTKVLKEVYNDKYLNNSETVSMKNK